MAGIRLFIIYTGGTIGMAFDDKGSLTPMPFNALKKALPELNRLGYEFDVHAFQPPIDSSNISPEIWVQLAQIIEQNYEGYDGFVILHGSDTMAYTASALSFMFDNLGKPVVLTGSQLPLGEIRTDARENLITAMEIAAAKKPDGSTMVPEVCIYFDYQLLRGNRTQKVHTERFDAFSSYNYPPIAEAKVHLHFHTGYIHYQTDGSFSVQTRLEPNIGVLKLFPGITPAFVAAVLNAPGLKAVVLETYGTGNAITEEWFLSALRNAINKDILIVDRTQCSGGSVELGRYTTSAELLEMGVLSAADMTFEATITKLMVYLAQTQPLQEVKKQIEQSQKGELTEK